MKNIVRISQLEMIIASSLSLSLVLYFLFTYNRFDVDVDCLNFYGYGVSRVTNRRTVYIHVYC